MSLQELHIQNFKFFREVEPRDKNPLLNINGRHVLVYGENGSGKSTIYWALYTLLEASFKEDDREIEKYFDRRKAESLINIYSSSGEPSFVEAIIDDGNGSTINYKVSKSELGIKGQSDVMESNMASDFINYRMLLQLHNVKHSEENELFFWFLEEVLPYVKKDGIPCLNEFEEVRNPEKITDVNGEEIYPYAKLQEHPDEGMEQHYQDYKSHKNKLKEWNKWFLGFLEITFTETNRILEADFKYNFKVGFDFTKAKYSLSDDHKEFYFKPPKIYLKIEEYEGNPNPDIKKPHTFLNEAKWSAIGLAIRFAILNRKLDPAQLKCLIIDDMLLSLDMSNRDVLTKLLLDKYADEYQILLMTHDLSYFTWLKHELQSRDLLAQGDWKVLEMYVDDSENLEKPVILNSDTELSIAIKHFKNFDYAASANYLRKHAEKILCDWLPEYCWKDPEKADLTKNKMALQNIIDAGIKFLGRIYQSPELYKELKKYVSILLNPLSHVDVGVSRYKVEIESIIKILKDIESLHETIEYEVVLAGGEEIQIRIPKPSVSQIYTYVFELNDSLFEVNDNGTMRLSLCKATSKICYPINDDGSKGEETKFEYYPQRELYGAYSEICNRDEEFSLEENFRPFLYNSEGENI